MNVREGGGSINWILMAALAVVIVTVGVWTWDRVRGRKQPGGNPQENSG
jgi:cytoskeletal protein RodZ